MNIISYAKDIILSLRYVVQKVHVVLSTLVGCVPYALRLRCSLSSTTERAYVLFRRVFDDFHYEILLLASQENNKKKVTNNNKRVE